MIEEFYSVEEVAKKLGLCPTTIRRRIAEGKIEPIRSNGQTGRIRISQSEFNKFATRQTAERR